MREHDTGHRGAVTPSGVEEPRSGRVATADADLPSLSYGISSATPQALLGAGNEPMADGPLAGELASGWAKAAVRALHPGLLAARAWEGGLGRWCVEPMPTR